MATEKSIAEALEYSLTVTENVFLSAFYNQVCKLVDKAEENQNTFVYTSDLKPLIEFVEECNKNVPL